MVQKFRSNPTGLEGEMNEQWPFDTDEVLVQFCYITHCPAFLAGVSGRVIIGELEEMEKDCNDNLEEVFTKGAGDYLFRATFFPGQYGDDGRCELQPGWELTELAYRKMDMGGDSHDSA